MKAIRGCCPFLRIGNTPLWESLYGNNRPQRLLKLEGANGSRSMKARSAYTMLVAERLTPGATIIESTSGNMGVALAQVGKALGLQVVLVVDPKLTLGHREAMLQSGAQLIEVEDPDETGGWLRTRLIKVRDLCQEHPDWRWINQYGNPYNPEAFEVVVEEVVGELGMKYGWRHRGVHLDRCLWFFGAVGTGGSLTGSARALHRFFHHLPSSILGFTHYRVVAVDAEGSRIFGCAGKPRHLVGIGSSLSAAELPNLRPEFFTDVTHVSDAEAFRACWWLWKEAHIKVGGSTGAVWAAMNRFEPRCQPHDVMVGVSADAGTIYETTIYNERWLRERGLWHEVVPQYGSSGVPSTL